MQPTTGLLKKRIVLVGAGNAHLQIVRKWAMKPIKNASLSIITDALSIPYSGMVPGFLSRHYERNSVLIDLQALAAVAGVELIHAKATKISPEEQSVELDGRPPIFYDLVSLGLGSSPILPLVDSESLSLPVKPLSGIMKDIERLDSLVTQKRETKIAVVGSGAGGCEILLSLFERYKQSSGSTKFSLIEGSSAILPSYPDSMGRKFRSIFDARHIDVLLGSNVKQVAAGEIQLESGTSIEADAVLWATRAGAPEFAKNSSLATDSSGFIKVKDSLQTLEYENVFATGDLASLASYPKLPKAGVYAVRQGPTLWTNLNRAVEGKALKDFAPQRNFLTILNVSDGTAVSHYRGLVRHSKGAWNLKRYIDGKWMKKFQDLTPLSNMGGDDTPMRCGGCGSKIPSQVLSEALRKLQIPKSEHVLVGCSDNEDAAVMTSTPNTVQVQSVDFFRSFISDPFVFGQVAANNALSDLYAMNAAPKTALAIVNLPYAKAAIQQESLFQMLSGANEVLKEAGAVLVGGHTSEAAETALGFSVTGEARQEDLFSKAALKDKDQLILTQAVGSGALLAAQMQGKCRSDWFEILLTNLRLSNSKASKIFAEAGVKACSDITGFGLAGHLLEMLSASKLKARLTQLPTYPGFAHVTEKEGIFSTLHPDNLQFQSQVTGEEHPALYDPQTSGGLLAGVSTHHAQDVLEKLRANGYPDSAIVGLDHHEWLCTYHIGAFMIVMVLAALAVGVLLGLVGGGGGLITMPTLMYVGGFSPKSAIAHALAIVGIITLQSAYREWRANRVQTKGALAFVLAGMAGTFVGARVTAKLLPERFVVLFFTTMVVLAAIVMMRNALRTKSDSLSTKVDSRRTPLLVFVIFVTGIISGMSGLGGGFLMVPALSIIGGYPMTIAVGTNLVIIALKSVFGIVGYLDEVQFDLAVIVKFTLGGFVGSYIGTRLRALTSEKTLKLTFGIFLIIMGSFLVWDKVL